MRELTWVTVGRWAGVVAMTGAFACGELEEVNRDDGTPSSDGGAPSRDGGAQEDSGPPAIFITDAIDGTWSFSMGAIEDPDTVCTAVFDDGTFNVTCPNELQDIDGDCEQVTNESRVTGTWTTESLVGLVRSVSRYEGADCGLMGHTPNQDLIDSEIEMEATLTPDSVTDGFLHAAYGLWNWEAWDPDDTEEKLKCDATFGPGEGSEGAAVDVECLSEPESVSADCSKIEAVVIRGTFKEGSFNAEGWSETRHTGADCSGFLDEKEEATPMRATSN